MKIKPKKTDSFLCSYCTQTFGSLDALLLHENDHEKAFDKGEKLTSRDNVKTEEFNPEN